MAMCLQGLMAVRQGSRLSTPAARSTSILLMALRDQSTLTRNPALSSCIKPTRHAPLPIIFRRTMAGKRFFVIQPSRYVWRRFKSDLHFFVMLGVLPLAAISYYTNVYIGESELREIPEGYYPKEWEYHKHPITRWLAKHIVAPPQRGYEMAMTLVDNETEKMRLRRLYNKVTALQAERKDYQGYMFEPGAGAGAFIQQDHDHMQVYWNESHDALAPPTA